MEESHSTVTQSENVNSKIDFDSKHGKIAVCYFDCRRVKIA